MTQKRGGRLAVAAVLVAVVSACSGGSSGPEAADCGVPADGNWSVVGDHDTLVMPPVPLTVDIDAEQRACPGGTVRIRVRIHNTSSSPQVLSGRDLEVWSGGQGWNLEPISPPGPLSLAPDGKFEIDHRVQLPFLPPGTYTLRLSGLPASPRTLEILDPTPGVPKGTVTSTP